MALFAKQTINAGRSEPITAGSYPARLIQIIDLGLQPGRKFQNQEKPPAQEIMLVYELLDEFMKDENGNDILDKPRVISESMTFYPHTSERAKSAVRYKALDPTISYGGDWSQLIDSPCMVTIVTNERKGMTYNNIASVSKMRDRDAEKAPPSVNPKVIWDNDNPNAKDWDNIYNWVKKIILGNLNYQGSALQKLGLTANDGAPAKQEEKGAKVEAQDLPY